MMILPSATQPVTFECIVRAASRFELPARLLIAVLQVEGGQVGQVRANPNGSYDIGPMQINSLWLPVLSSYVSPERLKNDGCVNVQVGAWILKKYILEAQGDFWTGVGYYHSHTPDRAARYRQKVHHASQHLDSMRP